MFKVEFETDNEAFNGSSCEAEIKRILQKIAMRVANGETEGAIMDYNGNRVGSFELTDH
jgi:hypothetical protein